MCQLAVDKILFLHIVIIMSNDVFIKFANKLKCIREKLNLTQEELAFMCNIDRTSIGRIENCKRKPNLETIDKIAKGLNMKLCELLDFN